MTQPPSFFRLLNDVISFGNVEVVLWALFACSAISAKAEWFYAVMILIKPYAAWPLLVRFARTKFKNAIYIAAWVAACTCTAVWSVGILQFICWFRWVGPSAGQGTFLVGNWSLSFALLRLARMCGIWHYSTGPLPIGPRLFLALMAVVGPSVCIFVARKLPTKQLEWLSYFAGMMFSPLCWGHYLVTLYVPVAAFLSRHSTSIDPKNVESSP